MKADCYGLGVDLIAPALAAAGARTFFVATLGEGLDLRRLLGAGPAIYVLNGLTPEDAAPMRAAQLTPVLNSPAQIALWDGPCALHVDTGMNRLGLQMRDLSAAEALQPAIVMSHLACASDPSDPMNAVQRARFVEASVMFPKARKSLAASAGALHEPEFAFDLIRPGVGLYGGGPLDRDNPALAVVATLTAPLLSVFDVEAGESVGYGASFVAPKRLRAATAAFGYADGWLRSLSGKGYGVVGGVKCPLLGRVSMDLITLDVSAVPGAQAGDEVEFLGSNAKLDEMAALAETIPYEILTNLSGVRRVLA